MWRRVSETSSAPQRLRAATASSRYQWDSLPLKCVGGELEQQYVVLMGRLRQAQCFQPEEWASWWLTKEYRVRPIVTNAHVAIVVTKCVARAAAASGMPCDNLLGMRATSLVCHFLARTADQESKRYSPILSDCFLLPHRALARLGTPWRTWHAPEKAFGKGGTKAASRWGFDVRRSDDTHGVAILLWPGVVGKLVHVIQEVQELDWDAVSASIDLNPYFTCGRTVSNRRAPCVWHAIKVHNHCRTMMAQETPCEQTGSEMKRVWDLTGLNQNVSGPIIMDGVILRDADVKCIGGARDEAICHFIASCLDEAGRRATLGRSAIFQHGHADYRARLGIHAQGDSHSLARLLAKHEQRLIQSGRYIPTASSCNGFEPRDESGSDGDITFHEDDNCLTDLHKSLGRLTYKHGREVIRQHRARSLHAASIPTELRKPLQEKIGKGTVEALPLFKEDKRTKAKDRAGSTLADVQKAWLCSMPGKTWLHEQTARWDVPNVGVKKD